MGYQNPYQGSGLYEQPGMERPTMQFGLMVVIAAIATIGSVWIWVKPYWAVTGRLQQWLGNMYQYNVENGMKVPSEGLAITAVALAVAVGLVLAMIARKKVGVPILIGALLGVLFSNMIYLAILIGPTLTHL